MIRYIICLFCLSESNLVSFEITLNHFQNDTYTYKSYKHMAIHTCTHRHIQLYIPSICTYTLHTDIHYLYYYIMWQYEICWQLHLWTHFILFLSLVICNDFFLCDFILMLCWFVLNTYWPCKHLNLSKWCHWMLSHMFDYSVCSHITL